MQNSFHGYKGHLEEIFLVSHLTQLGSCQPWTHHRVIIMVAFVQLQLFSEAGKKSYLGQNQGICGKDDR